MFAGKSSITKIYKMHFRTLQIVYNNYDKSYRDVLNFSNYFSIHQKHLRSLALEVNKSLMNINIKFKWEFFNKTQFSTIYIKEIIIVINNFNSFLQTECERGLLHTLLYRT